MSVVTHIIKNSIKHFASKIKIDTFQRLMAYSILKNEFKETQNIQSFESREELWDDCIKNQLEANTNITYIEFGVHEGVSIKYFAANIKSEKSVFIGLDSFEGLPEDWGPMSKGTFNTSGAIPKIDDKRVSFIKGWFQNTWNELNNRLQLSKIDNLVVHYDADLYSSTLFALSKIDTLKTSYIAIFDEFTGQETRALYNYCQSYNAKVCFISKTATNFDSTPNQLVCRITPNLTQHILND